MATTYLSPLGNEQQHDQNGAPLSGGKIFTYAAGTLNPIATYQDNAGAVNQANPIVLNTSGLPANPIWLPAGQAVKMVFTDANGVSSRPTVDNIVGINDPSGASTADQWVIYQGAPTFISATSFSVAGDQRNTFQIGRRVRTANSGGTVYGTVTNVAFSVVTTVTVGNDSGVLDFGLSQVSYGLLSATNPSSPVVNRAFAEYTANADLTTQIPGDDTIPQNTEGTQIISVSLTPRSASSRVRLRFQGDFALLNTGSAAFALFSSASANALKAALVAGTGATLPTTAALEHEYVPGSTAALTFSVRAGPIATNTMRLNGNTSTRFFGGVMGATLVVEEFAA